MIFNFEMTTSEMILTKGEDVRQQGLYKDFTLDKLDRLISKLSYTGQKRAISKAVEDEYYFPVMVKCFEEMFFDGRIPDEKDLIDTFVKRYFIPTNEGNVYIARKDKEHPDPPKYRLEFIIGRLLRSYPSFIRDMHFHYLSVDSKEFDSVYYSYYSDTNKHDSILTYQGQTFGIRLLAKTARSDNYLSIKDGRHSASEIPEISVYMDFKPEYKHGSIYLYGQDHIEEIKKQMQDYLTIK